MRGKIYDAGILNNTSLSRFPASLPNPPFSHPPFEPNIAPTNENGYIADESNRTFAMWLALTDERACFVRHQFPSGKLSQPTQCPMYTEAAYGKAGALALLPDPCSVPWCRSIPVGQRRPDTSDYVQFTHPQKNSFIFVEYQARHSHSVTHRLVIHRQQLTYSSYPNHPCLNSGQSTPCLLPTMAYASDTCFHLSTTCCTHAPPHALVSPFWTLSSTL